MGCCHVSPSTSLPAQESIPCDPVHVTWLLNSRDVFLSHAQIPTLIPTCITSIQLYTQISGDLQHRKRGQAWKKPIRMRSTLVSGVCSCLFLGAGCGGWNAKRQEAWAGEFKQSLALGKRILFFFSFNCEFSSDA